MRLLLSIKVLRSFQFPLKIFQKLLLPWFPNDHYGRWSLSSASEEATAMNRGGTLGSRHCHCMLQLPAFTQRFSKFYFLPTVSEPLQWTQPEWPASHKKPFRGKLNDLETRPSKAFKGLFECSREFRLSGCCISGWPGRPGGKTSRFWRKPTALCCLAGFFLHCFTLRHYFCRQKDLVEKCIWFFLQQNKITTNSSVDKVFQSFLIYFYDPTFDGTSRRLSFRHHSLQSRRFFKPSVFKTSVFAEQQQIFPWLEMFRLHSGLRQTHECNHHRLGDKIWNW